MRHAGPELVPARQQRGSRRRARRTHVKIGEPRALVVQVIQIRRLHHRVTQTRDVPVTLVVGQYKNDVGRSRPLRARDGSRGTKRGEKTAPVERPVGRERHRSIICVPPLAGDRSQCS